VKNLLQIEAGFFYEFIFLYHLKKQSHFLRNGFASLKGNERVF
tara:strand:+ start:743 stop:871 length:129 start_codon:yes stop_codon:yes gene_type:complete